jgi:hypothetical protein
MKKTFLVSVLTLPFLAGEAQAADLSLFAGYLNPGSLNFNNVVEGLDLRGSSLYGGRFETDFHHVIGLEHTVAFSPSLGESRLFPSGGEKVHGFLYHSNLVLNVPVQHMVPYITAGIGLMKPYGPGTQPFGTRFAFNYGGGLKLPRLAGMLGLRFDVRGYAVPDVNSQTLNLFEASGGLMFTFGRD